MSVLEDSSLKERSFPKLGALGDGQFWKKFQTTETQWLAMPERKIQESMVPKNKEFVVLEKEKSVVGRTTLNLSGTDTSSPRNQDGNF